MGYLVFILITLALLAAFIVLTAYETEHGFRFFAAQREELDRNVERLAFVYAHVDFAAFLRDETRRLANRIGHDIAQFVLILVRAVERFLTRVVRYFRTRRAVTGAPRPSTREFVKTLAQFKGHLEATRPDVPEL